MVEIGGLGWGESQEREWLDQNVTGTLGVMKHLGMMEGTPQRSARYLLIEDYFRVSPRKGGYLEPVVGLDRQLTEVARGNLTSPGRGVIFYMCRSYMARPGAWAFGIANLEDGKSRWVAQ